MLVHLELCDDNVGRVDRDERGLAGELGDRNRLNVDAHRPELDGGDAAGPAAELAADDLNLVIAADWEALDTVRLLQVLGERRAHGDVLLLFGGVEEGLADLASLGRDERVGLHFERPKRPSLFTGGLMLFLYHMSGFSSSSGAVPSSGEGGLSAPILWSSGMMSSSMSGAS